MARGSFFKDAFDKAKSKLEGFLYHDDTAVAAPAPSINDEGYAPGQPEAYPQGRAAYGYPQQPYQQPYGQAPYQPQQPYQQPQEQAYQQPAYQPPVQPQAAAYTRNRRADRTPVQPENNVVDFAAYQQQAQPEDTQAQNSGVSAAWNARIINARGMGDCRSAITLLRSGDSVLIVLENISDPAEMRRLVDTLSGACYSLTATITKVSRSGVYLLAPQAVAVYADQATNQMNMSPSRAPMRAPQNAYAAPQMQRAPYPPQAAYQQPAMQNVYQQPAPQGVYAAAPQSGFTQRTTAPEEAAQPFYTRQPAQGAQIPAFSAQPAGYGYAPDEAAAVEQ